MTYQNDSSPMPGEPLANLIVKQGTQIGIQFPIRADTVILGREDGCDIVIQDAEVSRRHCQVKQIEDQFIIQDLNSTNGTYVNNAQITSATPLSSGDIISIGQTTLIFEGQYDTAISVDTSAGVDSEEFPMPPDTIETKGITQQQWIIGGCGCLVFLVLLVVGVPILLQLAGIIDMETIIQGLGI